MKERLILLGGGGLALEMLDYINQDGYSVYGYYANSENPLLSKYIQWLGNERESIDHDASYIIATGLISIRKELISFIEYNNLNMFSFISSKAWVSSISKIDKGCFIAPFSAITGNANIGSYFFSNIFSNVSHHCVLGQNIVVGPGARINGHCYLGNNISLGANSALIPGTKLEDEVEIGITAYPPKKVKENRLIFSQPGSTLKK